MSEHTRLNINAYINGWLGGITMTRPPLHALHDCMHVLIDLDIKLMVGWRHRYDNASTTLTGRLAAQTLLRHAHA